VAAGEEPGRGICPGNGEMRRDRVDMTALIRSIQRAEGNPDCFRRGEPDCPYMECAWRSYCLPRGPSAPVDREQGNPPGAEPVRAESAGEEVL